MTTLPKLARHDWVEAQLSAKAGLLDAFRNSAEAVRSKVLANQPAVWCHLGDSTGDWYSGEWLGLAVEAWREDFPGMKVTHELWNDAAQAYDAAAVVQYGIPQQGTRALTDTFTRSGALGGSATDTGQVWTVAAGNAGTMTGGIYTIGNSWFEASVPHGIDPNATGFYMTARATMPAGATGKFLRLFAARSALADELYLALDSNATNIVVSIFKTVGGATTALAQQSFALDNAVARTVDAAFAYRDGRVYGHVQVGSDARTMTAAIGLDPAAWAGFANPANRVVAITCNIIGASIDYLTIGATSADPAPFRIINGSAPGKNLDYIQPRLAAMCPTAPDLITVSSSHNHGTQIASEYLAQLDLLVDTLHTTYPQAGIALVGQNPQFPPGPTADAHNARITTVRAHAKALGLGYIGATEKFLARFDRGQSWVADGVHPNASGYAAWRDAALTFLRGHPYG